MLKTMNNKLIILLGSFVLSACGGGGDGDSTTTTTNPAITGSHQVLAFNDLGMHCADLDYSVFTILPPYNVVHAQVIERGDEPRILDNAAVSVSYRGIADASGSINTTSQNKTNFWDTNPATGNSYAFDLFGLDPQPDEGLALDPAMKQAMPGISNPYVANVPQLFKGFEPAQQWFKAVGVPIMPIDDSLQTNTYPLMQISATDKATGDALANLDVVLPVAAEADCQNCHATDQDRINFPDPADLLNAAKRNILALHDSEHGTTLSTNTPVLCAECHYSAALDLAGTGPLGDQQINPTMSNVMHEFHGNNATFLSDSMEDTCYQCHPGNTTQCLRGAMGSAGIDCNGCHGSMLAVGNPNRLPWVDEPRCESCHTGDAVSNLAGDTGTVVNTVDTDGNIDNIRLRQAWLTGDATADPIIATNKRFAEDDATLYRNSLGHNGVACEACHGSTHAIWPSSKANDNKAAIDLQGYSGTISDCAVCHTSLPLTLGGPHGMHNVNSSGWNLGHENFYESNPNACRACHGVNLEGTVLSRTAADRVYQRDDDGATISVPKGTPVRCNMCHSTP